MNRYVTVRQAGAWHVQDVATGELVQSFPPGATGAAQASAAARALEQSTSRQAPQNSGARSELRAWRLAHGLSQAALARHLGVQWLAVQRWEAGTRALPALLERALRDLDQELLSRV